MQEAKDRLKNSNNIFNQLLKHLPRHQFQKTVDRHGGDHRVRNLSCRVQLVSLMLAQMTGRTSLRDLEESFNAKHNHHYHLEVKSINIPLCLMGKRLFEDVFKTQHLTATLTSVELTH